MACETRLHSHCRQSETALVSLCGEESVTLGSLASPSKHLKNISCDK